MQLDSKKNKKRMPVQDIRFFYGMQESSELSFELTVRSIAV